jgi:ribonuclease P protein component
MYWGLYFASPDADLKPDLGIAVAKKLVKRAVDRNQLKRMIREVMRTTNTSKLRGDVVVKLKKPIGRDSRGRLRKQEKDVLREQILGLI